MILITNNDNSMAVPKFPPYIYDLILMIPSNTLATRLTNRYMNIKIGIENSMI